MHHTLDWVMGMGVNTPKPTISVMLFDVVPIRAIDGGSKRRLLGCWPTLENALLGWVEILRLAVEEGVELRQLQLDRRDIRLDVRLPIDERLIEQCRRRLQRGDALIPLPLHDLELGEALVEGVGVRCEALLDLAVDLLHQLLNPDLRVGLHRTEASLTAGVVEMWFQIGRRISVDLIPSVRYREESSRRREIRKNRARGRDRASDEPNLSEFFW
jgi:hypothetical protein